MAERRLARDNIKWGRRDGNRPAPWHQEVPLPMRLIGSLLAAVVLLAATAIPATAAPVQRGAATTCTGYTLRAYKIIPGAPGGASEWRQTNVPCNGWVPDPWNKPWYVVNRPYTDLEAAARSAAAWWGHCQRTMGGSFWGGGGFGGTPGFYYTYFTINC